MHKWSERLQSQLSPGGMGNSSFASVIEKLIAVAIKKSYLLPGLEKCLDFFGIEVMFPTYAVSRIFLQGRIADENQNQPLQRLIMPCIDLPTSHLGLRMSELLYDGVWTFYTQTKMQLSFLHLKDTVSFLWTSEESFDCVWQVVSLQNDASLSINVKMCDLKWKFMWELKGVFKFDFKGRLRGELRCA